MNASCNASWAAPGRAPAQGFSLLEAIVALAILASVGLAVFASINASLMMVERAARSQEGDTAARNAIAWLEVMNPMEVPEGEERVGDFVMRWNAVALEPPRPAVTVTMAPGLYEVALYEVEVEVVRDDALVRQFTLRRMGHRQVRTPAAL